MRPTADYVVSKYHSNHDCPPNPGQIERPVGGGDSNRDYTKETMVADGPGLSWCGLFSFRVHLLFIVFHMFIFLSVRTATRYKGAYARRSATKSGRRRARAAPHQVVEDVIVSVARGARGHSGGL